ncbi:MAG: hypothetical protein JST33_11500 [Actinobacteria bacterium]|nr:hypothetical protein [Actinomycetota bacterium]
MGMYGADVAQLRSLAAQFDSQASQLDAHRMTVGNAIRISAWMGPVAVRFRAQWDSDYSRRVHGAAGRLRAAAIDLRRNADEQDRASAVGGVLDGNDRSLRPTSTSPLGPIPLHGSGFDIWNGIKAFTSAHDVLEDMRHGMDATVKIAEHINWHVATKDVPFLTNATRAMIGAETDLGSALKDVGSKIDIAGNVLGGAGVLANGAEMVADVSRGDTAHAMVHGAQAILGAIGFVPGPIGWTAAGVSVGISVATYAIDHPEVVRQAEHIASDVGQAAVKAAEGTAKNVSGFVSGVGSAVKSWLHL